jgi:hypothetical protein
VSFRPDWWISTVQKMRQRYPSEPDKTFVRALDDTILKMQDDPKVWQTQRAFSFYRGCVEQIVKNGRESGRVTGKPEPKRRTAADLIAAEAAIWGGDA